MKPAASPVAQRAPERPLLVFGLAVGLLHHLGAATSALPRGDGATTGDWLDLIVPVAVVGTALAALLAAGADRLGWGLFAVGALLYVEGHGIHLAANSVSNVLERHPAPGPVEDVVHLWDEVVGHYIWYAGLALLVVALARPLLGRRLHVSLLGWATAVAVGVTWATNGLEGGTAVASLLVAVGFVAWGWRHRTGSGLLLLAAYVPAVVILVGWGLAHGGFPQPSAT